MLEKRQLHLSKIEIKSGDCVIYVMSRDQRVHDNHALLSAQALAIDHKLPLVVQFNVREKLGVRSKEQYDFMFEGLVEVEKELDKLNIGFIVSVGDAVENVLSTASKLKPISIFFDFSPLKYARNIQKSIASQAEIPCIVVDTHNIIPLWVLSDKEEFAAHTIRNKVHKNLESWLVEPEKIVKHPYSFNGDIESASLADATKRVEATSTGVVTDFKSGEKAAHSHLKNFIDSRLSDYANSRNIPTLDGQSDLSPYLHFGHISSLRVALELLRISNDPPLLFIKGKLASFEGEPTKMDNINALLEELIVRKELADNYCFYNSNYDSLAGAKDWARKSLEDHLDDARENIYSLNEWESAKTHDEPWNAAQNEMMISGKMHGYMRMYWAKKILEWSSSPEEAIKIACYLNDRYSIDGGDPNGYTGIMWSIAGIHDRAWFERDIFGKIRYMNSSGLARKFDLASYISKWNKK